MPQIDEATVMQALRAVQEPELGKDIVTLEMVKELALSVMTVDDLDEVLEIERASFSTPWSATSFFNEIKNPRSLSKVARLGGRIEAEQSKEPSAAAVQPRNTGRRMRSAAPIVSSVRVRLLFM